MVYKKKLDNGRWLIRSDLDLPIYSGITKEVHSEYIVAKDPNTDDYHEVEAFTN